ncbi:MAG: glycosyltransferase [Lautropia sp.]
MRILTSVHFYLPGYKAGGPVRSLANLVEQTGRDFSFLVVTCDRDLGDSRPYPGVDLSGWNEVKGAQVAYVAPTLSGLLRLMRLFVKTPHDVLYLNSLFNPVYTLLPLALRKLRIGPSTPVVIAPRGELSAGALGLKKTKKLALLRLAKLMRLYQPVTWHASSEFEATDIKDWFGRKARIVIAVNVPSSTKGCGEVRAGGLQEGAALRVVFLSRITPKKNLEFALRVLKRVSAPVEFAIYGPHVDRAYLARCRDMAEAMPGNVNVQWHDAVPPEQVVDVLAGHDLFFFPTRGENYGHVIAEALTAGTPVLISDSTPWRGLDLAGVGWDIGLEHEAKFVERIEQCARIPRGDYTAWRGRVALYAQGRLALPDVVEANRRLFRSAV